MTRTRYTIRDVGGALDWASLSVFVYGLMRDRTSLLWREVNDPKGETSPWIDGSRTAAVAADLFDLIAWFKHDFDQSHSKKKVKRPKPYPRPWVDDGKKKIGSDPIKVSAFQEWWDAQEPAE